MGEWIATVHPSAIIQDRTKNLRAWLHDTWKIRRILRGRKGDQDVVVVMPETKAEFDAEVEGWTDFAYDLETDKENNRLVHCMAVANETKAVVLDSVCGAQISWAVGLFQRPGKRYVQNGVFDMPILRDHGIHYDWSQTFDTLIAGAVLGPDEPNALAYLASVYLDYWAWKYCSGGNLAVYNGEDACLTYRIAQEEIKELKEKNQWGYLNSLMPVVWELLIPLHETGANINEAKRQELILELEKRVRNWQASLEDHFGSLSTKTGRLLSVPLGDKGGFSYSKMVKLLYSDLHLPMQRDPETNNPSTSYESLKRLEPKDKTGTVTLLLEGSKLSETSSHLYGTAPGTDGRVHTRFVLGGDEKHESLQGVKGNRNAPRTGRLSSRRSWNGPGGGTNLQNMSWKSRYVISASPGMRLVERDYSQIELRLNAYFSKDPGLEAALKAGDAHLYIAWLCDQYHGQYEIANYTWDECYGRFLDKDPKVKRARKKQKTPTYGWFYRMGAEKLYLVYDVPVKEGKVLLRGLNNTFHGVVDWWQRLVAEVTLKRFYQNPFGRRRYFFNIREEVPAICNTPAQSTAADILYCAMLSFQRMMQKTEVVSPPPGRLILTVHDQMLAEGPNPTVLNSALRAAMSQPFPELGGMVVPSDAKTGELWGPRLAPDDVPEWGLKAGDIVDDRGMVDLED